MVRAFMISPCSHMNSAAAQYISRTMISSWPSAPNFMPSPGVNSMPESMSASSVLPSACAPAMTCSRLSPSGMRPETAPEKMMSIACPNTLGA